MNLINLKKVSDYDVMNWLERKIPDLTDRQKRIMRDSEMVRFAPFDFMERRKKVNNVWLRLTIVVMPIVLLGLIASLPFNFIITGKWGYDRVEWYSKWVSKCGL